MASLRVNKAKFKSRTDAYIAKVSRTIEAQSYLWLQLVLEMAKSRAPSRFEEERLVNGGDMSYAGNIKFVKMDDKKDSGRSRFFKSSSQEFLVDAISNPFNYLRTSTGFKVGNVVMLDLLTRWSWTNAMINKGVVTSITHESNHGTFWFFEYGYQWVVKPHYSKELLSPEPGIYTGSITKSIPAFAMFTGIDPGSVLAAMKETIREVEF